MGAEPARLVSQYPSFVVLTGCDIERCAKLRKPDVANTSFAIFPRLAETRKRIKVGITAANLWKLEFDLLSLILAFRAAPRSQSVVGIDASDQWIYSILEMMPPMPLHIECDQHCSFICYPILVHASCFQDSCNYTKPFLFTTSTIARTVAIDIASTHPPVSSRC